MKRKKHTPEQIIDKPNQIQALVAWGVLYHLLLGRTEYQMMGITENTFYRWKNKCLGRWLTRG